MIYLDSASTQFLHPNAKKAMFDGFDIWANPSGLHQASQKAKLRLEEARKLLKQILNVQNNAELVFTSSASEANNAIFNTSPLPVLISQFEHPSIAKHPKTICFLDEQDLEKKIQKERYLVSLSLVNNESGMLVANKGIVQLVHKYGSKVHVDASQAKKIDFQALGCDYMTISSHKMGGPIGVAGLISRTTLPTFIFGGGQEFDIRSGTEPLPLIEGFVAAARTLEDQYVKAQELSQLLRSLIPAKFFFSTFVEQDFAPNIECLLTYQYSGTEIYAMLDLSNIVVAYGSACSSGAINGPTILKKFKTPTENGIRVSFGWHSSKEDICSFASIFKDFFD